MQKLKALYHTFESQKVELIREVYTDELGELCLMRDRLMGKHLQGTGCGADTGEPVSIDGPVRDILTQIERCSRVARLFESFTPEAWIDIPRDSMIGRCLDDDHFLLKRTQKARRNKPGEVAGQIWQRYKQTYGSGPLSAGVLFPALDLTMQAEPSTDARSGADAAGVGAASAAGAVTFTAATGMAHTS